MYKKYIWDIIRFINYNHRKEGIYMDIKLLAVDIDETMVNSHHKMTTVTQQALKKAMEQGTCSHGSTTWDSASWVR